MAVLQFHFLYLVLMSTGQFANKHGQGQRWVFTGQVSGLLICILTIINGFLLVQFDLRVT